MSTFKAKATLISFGDSYPSIAMPYLSDKLLAELLQAECYTREYLPGPNGEYSSVWVRNTTVLRFDTIDVFRGTAEEYRKLPKIEQPEPPAED
jgi:hypothetical protein